MVFPITLLSTCVWYIAGGQQKWSVKTLDEESTMASKLGKKLRQKGEEETVRSKDARAKIKHHRTKRRASQRAAKTHRHCPNRVTYCW